jgi:hypothetical protein
MIMSEMASKKATESRGKEERRNFSHARAAGQDLHVPKDTRDLE